MMRCAYCDELEKGFFEFEGHNYGSRILFESDNFVVFPSLGQIVEGYLLIAPKKHYIGVSGIPKELYPELEEVCEKVRNRLLDVYGRPLFFEHGPHKESKGGCCIDHAHIHAIPVQTDLFPDLAKHFEPKEIVSFNDLKIGAPYFYYESNLGKRFVFKLPAFVSSQYIRQVIAINLGIPERWDWRTYPYIDEIKRTIRKLK